MMYSENFFKCKYVIIFNVFFSFFIVVLQHFKPIFCII